MVDLGGADLDVGVSGSQRLDLGGQRLSASGGEHLRVFYTQCLQGVELVLAEEGAGYYEGADDGAFGEAGRASGFLPASSTPQISLLEVFSPANLLEDHTPQVSISRLSSR